MSFNIEKILGKEANYLLGHKCNTVKKEHLHLPGPDFVDRVMTPSDRNPVVLRNMQTLFNNGRMGGSTAMKLFIYVGLAIGLFGLGKIVYRWWEEKGQSGEEKIMVTIDGQEGFILKPKDEVIIKKSGHKARLITFKEKSFYAILREKLRWSGQINK